MSGTKIIPIRVSEEDKRYWEEARRLHEEFYRQLPTMLQVPMHLLQGPEGTYRGEHR